MTISDENPDSFHDTPAEAAQLKEPAKFALLPGGEQKGCDFQLAAMGTSWAVVIKNFHDE